MPQDREDKLARKLRETTGKSLMDCVFALRKRGYDIECAEEYLINRGLKKPVYPKWDKMRGQVL